MPKSLHLEMMKFGLKGMDEDEGGCDAF